MARDYAKFSPRFWTGGTGRRLRRNRSGQVLAAYLISAPGSTMTGIYYLPLLMVAHETGMDLGEVATAFHFLSEIGFAFYDNEAEFVWVPEMAAWQVEEQLNPGDKRIIGIKRELGAIREHRFVGAFWRRYEEAFKLGSMPLGWGIEGPLEAPSVPLRSQDQDQDQEQEQDQEQPPPAGAPAIGGAGDAAREQVTPGGLMETWSKIRNEVFGGHPFDANGFGIKSEKARDAADLINATIGAGKCVDASMRKFWRGVRDGSVDDAQKVARVPAFAFGCWLAMFPGDLAESMGALPAIPKGAGRATGPPRDPRVGWARPSEQQHKGGGTDHEF